MHREIETDGVEPLHQTEVRCAPDKHCLIEYRCDLSLASMTLPWPSLICARRPKSVAVCAQCLSVARGASVGEPALTVDKVRVEVFCAEHREHSHCARKDVTAHSALSPKSDSTAFTSRASPDTKISPLPPKYLLCSQRRNLPRAFLCGVPRRVCHRGFPM